MFPILFEFPAFFGFSRFPIHAYGILIAIGFLVGVFFIKKEAKKRNLNVELVVDYCFSALFVGFIGSRFFFVLTMLSYFLENPLEVFYVWQGGMVFYGGPIFVVLYSFWFCKKHRLNIFTLGDVAVPGLAIGHAIGRIGCLAAGCCYGSECSYPWAVRLNSELVDANMRGVPLHPTQLYESILLLLLFLFLRTKSKHQTFRGQILLLYFMIYPVLRSIVEIFRGDNIRGFVINEILSTSQFISILVFVFALVVYVRQKKT